MLEFESSMCVVMVCPTEASSIPDVTKKFEFVGARGIGDVSFQLRDFMGAQKR